MRQCHIVNQELLDGHLENHRETVGTKLWPFKQSDSAQGSIDTMPVNTCTYICIPYSRKFSLGYIFAIFPPNKNLTNENLDSRLLKSPFSGLESVFFLVVCPEHVIRLLTVG